jgi:tetratricopeptide (TPR) repeat protein
MLPAESFRERIGEHVGIAPALPVTCRAFLLGSLAEVGAFTEGELHGAEGVRMADAAEHLTSRILAYWGVGRLALCKGDLQQALPALERGLRLCEISQVSTFFMLTAASLGYAYALCGRVAEALPLLQQGLEEADRSGFLYSYALWAAWRSEALLLVDRREDARALAQRALAHAREHQERGHQAYALRLLGEIAAQHQPPDIPQATAHYQQALALAEALGMRPLQAHCHRSRGTLYAAIGQREQACTALATALEMYTAMAMTFWLPQTKAVLAQVEEGH